MGAPTPDFVVTTARVGAILVVTVNNPPVNALGVAVRQGLAAAMAAAQADDAVAGVLRNCSRLVGSPCCCANAREAQAK